VRRAGPVTVEGSAVLPSGPDDACQAIGERYGCDVVPTLAFALQRPLSEVIQGTPTTLLSMRGQECRARTVDQ